MAALCTQRCSLRWAELTSVSGGGVTFTAVMAFVDVTLSNSIGGEDHNAGKRAGFIKRRAGRDRWLRLAVSVAGVAAVAAACGGGGAVGPAQWRYGT